MILRVKYMTKPGDQFLTRRHVYTRINALFEKEGITFAHRYVTVRVEDEEGEDANARRKAALGAAQPIIEGEISKPSGTM
ncbi:MAG: hypothetical protein AAF191_17975 [Verrucomicrobiota bacterium]